MTTAPCRKLTSVWVARDVVADGMGTPKDLKEGGKGYCL